ncbi:MAG: FAD:protein transferase [Actinomycetota bacterium]|jgi:thiamine biosynthesis lipoprotein|nr:FAD:protein transferase [Actinomycetota bacterium]
MSSEGGELRFRAMGSDAHVIVVGGPRHAAERIRDRILELEGRWSRFLDTSEISALNRHAGHPLRLSSETRLLVCRAIDAVRMSGGSFDPTVLGALRRAGYDRTFDEVALEPHHVDSDLQLGAGGIVVAGDVVRLPRGTGFDPGGIGKGLAADLVVGEAMADGASGVCVGIGGDVRVAGASPTDDGWTVAIEHPWQERPLVLVGIGDGAVATSTTLLRSWHIDGERSHHIIDPATSRPSDTDLTLAAVISADGWTSEILAKAVLLRGSRHPFDLIGGTAAVAITVDDLGRVQSSDGFTAFTGGVAVPEWLDLPQGADS